MSERTQTTFSLNELTFEAICQCQLVNFKINTDSSYARKNKTGIKGGGGSSIGLMVGISKTILDEVQWWNGRTKSSMLGGNFR